MGVMLLLGQGCHRSYDFTGAELQWELCCHRSTEVFGVRLPRDIYFYWSRVAMRFNCHSVIFGLNNC
jgi:hypothetical protein